MKGYKQLTEIQRYQVESLKKVDMQQKDMTLILGVSASAVSRELSRNTGKHCPEETNAKALGCRKNAAKTLKMTQEVCAFIEEKI